MICVSVQEKSFEACRAILKESPMAELRADLSALPLEQNVRLISSHPNLIFTCRIANSSQEYARDQMIAAIKHGVKYIDIEIEAPLEYAEPIALYAKESGTKLIISYHNYNATPSYKELREIAANCLRRGADIIKIVTTAESIADVTRVMRLYREYDPAGVVAFAMGECGKFSRYLSLRMGAPYTYVSFGEKVSMPRISGTSTAPGQYSKAELESLLAKKRERLNYKLNAESVEIPCSKSVAQRAIMASLYAEGESTLKNFEPCNDINGAVELVKEFGAEVICGQRQGEIVIKSEGAGRVVERVKEQSKEREIELNIGESGLLARLILPFAAYLAGESGQRTIRVTGHGSILGRNLQEAAAAIERLGLNCRAAKGENAKNGGAYLPFEISGRIGRQKLLKIEGSESSQTVSGLLMMLPLLPYNTELRIANPTSLPYIELTLSVLKFFSINIEQRWSGEELLFSIKGGQSYKALSLYLEPDWSSASFFAVIYAIASMKQANSGGGQRIYKLLNMPMDSLQADKAILDILRLSGVEVKFERTGKGSNVIIASPKELKSFSFDATNCPDLFPVAVLYSTFCKGRSEIKGVGRLMQKESNRAESIYSEFALMGADIEIDGDYMVINGTTLHGAALDCHNDHRIAMAVIAASLFIAEPVEIDDLKCIDKSFPSFTERL